MSQPTEPQNDQMQGIIRIVWHVIIALPYACTQGQGSYSNRSWKPGKFLEFEKEFQAWKIDGIWKREFQAWKKRNLKKRIPGLEKSWNLKNNSRPGKMEFRIIRNIAWTWSQGNVMEFESEAYSKKQTHADNTFRPFLH